MYSLKHLLLLLFFSLALFIPGMMSLPVTDRDEAYFAQATRQMLQTGHYFQIRFQDKTRFQKPPGINWLQAASVRVFSDASSSRIWPYRLPSVLGALLSALLLYFFAKQWVHSRTAILGGLLLSSSLLCVVEAHAAVTDACLLFTIVLMQGGLWNVYLKGLKGEPIHWLWPGCFWLGMALGMVLKGVTPLVGGLTLLSLCVLEKRVDWLSGLKLYTGFLFFLGVTCAWLFKVNAAEHSNYLLEMIHKDLLPKLQGGHESHGQPPFFHLALLPLMFWPASIFLWQAGCYAKRHRQDKAVRFLLAWILPTWIFFEIMPTKLPQYVLPTFPALALLCALAINDATKGTLVERILLILWWVLSFVLASVLMFIPYFVLHDIPLMSQVGCMGIVMTALAAVGWSWKGAYRRASMAVLLSALIAYPIIFEHLLPGLDPVWLSRNVSKRVKNMAFSSQNPLLAVSFLEPSLVFNLDTQRVTFIDANAAVQRMREDITRVALVDRDILRVWKTEGFEGTILATTRGFNYSKGRWMDLFLVTGYRGESNASL